MKAKLYEYYKLNTIKLGSLRKSFKLHIAFYILLVLLPVFLLGIYNTGVISREIESVTLENTKGIIQQQLQNVDNLYNRLNDAALDIMLRQNVVEQLFEYDGIYDFESIMSHNFIRNQLISIIVRSGELCDVSVILDDVIPAHIISTDANMRMMDATDRFWYLEHLNSPNSILLTADIMPGEDNLRPRIVMIMSLIDIHRRVRLGAVAIAVSNEQLMQNIGTIGNLRYYNQLITDQFGNVLFSSFTSESVGEYLLKNYLSTEGIVSQRHVINGMNYLVIRGTSNLSGLTIVYAVSQREMLRDVVRVRWINIAIMLIWMAFSFKIVQSIYQKNFQLVEQEKRKREYELIALQYQINPHFLYNTLDSIKWLASAQGSAVIEKTAQSLITLLKRTISDSSECISIQEELKNLEYYIEIQKIRYYNSFDYVVNAEECVLACNIPKLILQPLVENALFHGINDCGRRGVISVSVRREKDICVIVIMDNGNGMDVNRVKQQLSIKSRKGIGIGNVDERIKLYYGSNFGLSFESEIGEYTKVYVRIPYA